MSVTFNGNIKTIQVNSGVTSISVQNVYSLWKQWVMLSDNAKWSPAFRVVGGDPIGAVQTSPAYFFLTNGWTIRPDDTSGSHELEVSLNLYSDPETNNRFTPVSGVTIANKTSDAAGVAPQAIRDAMALPLSTGVTVQVGSLDELRQFEHNRWLIANNQLTIFADDGVTPLKVFDLFDSTGIPTNENPYERRPV